MSKQHVRKALNSFLPLLVLALIFSISISTSKAAPKSELLPQWKQSDENNSQSIDHSQWQNILDSYISTNQNGINLVDYVQLIDTDLLELNNYVDKLKSIDPREYSLNEQFAYWVNLYNAATVLLITDNYPLESITKIKGGLFSFGPWDIDWLDVAGETLSLNDIEHRILRPIWNDNRIHYAVNCASISCPNLSKQAFTSDNSEQLLDSLAKDYINHPRGVSINDGNLLISSIYDWYAVDFTQQGSDLVSHLSQFAEADLLSELQSLSDDNYKHDYDWNLNQVQ